MGQLSIPFSIIPTILCLLKKFNFAKISTEESQKRATEHSLRQAGELFGLRSQNIPSG